MKRAFFIASSAQNVGKTTSCLGLFSGLRSRFSSVGFLKPVGQEQVRTKEGGYVDKDVLLFKEQFNLAAPLELMSPVLIPPGFTRDFLNEKSDVETLKKRILHSYREISAQNACTLVEGTGHMGVGSIIQLNNAQVASLLNLPVLLILPAGVGSAFDLLSLNKALCEKHGTKLAGVILNRLKPEKKEMILEYMQKALAPLKIPLLGAIPFDPFLSSFSMKDFELLFQTPLMTGQDEKLRHYEQIRLIASSVDSYQESLTSSQLIMTPANREDIILATLAKYWDSSGGLEVGMILTGEHPPREPIVEQIKKTNIPMLWIEMDLFEAMQKISSFNAKIPSDDKMKIREAIQVVENHIDFERLSSTIA